MSQEAPNQIKKPAGKKAARKATSRPKAKTAAAPAPMPRAGVSVVPEIPPPAAVIARQRVSAWRVGLFSTLTIFVATFAWFSDTPKLPLIETHAGPAATAPSEEAASQVRAAIDQELRLATLALDIREGHENLSRLRDDTRSLASSIDALSNGIEKIKAEVAGSRDAAVEVARIEQRLWQMASAAALDAVDVSQLLERDIALMSRLDRIEAQLPAVQANLADAAATAGETTVTGALPDASPARVESAALTEPVPKADASPTVSSSRPRARGTARKRIDGWVVRNVEGDLALLDNNGTHYEVKAGDLLPRAGHVQAIKSQKNGWAVVTSRGVITEAR